MDINYQNLNDFHQTLSTAFFNALASQPPIEWERVASRFGSGSARNTYPFLGELHDMREWLGPRVIQQLESHRYSIENRLFELTMKASRTEMEDDAGGLISVYAPRAAIMARSVAVQPDQLIMRDVIPGGSSTPCYDGQNFFDTAHPVGLGTPQETTASNDMGGSGDSWYLLDTSRPLKPFIYQERTPPVFTARVNLQDPHVFMMREFLWGAERRNAGGYGLWQTAVKSSQTLTYANLKDAWNKMIAYTNDEGRNLGLRPNLLVVPLSLMLTARELLDFQWQITSGAAAQNPAYKMVDYMASVYLPHA